MTRTTACALLLAAFLLRSPAAAQLGEEVRNNIARVDRGEAEEVKKILPDLVAKYQNTPGMMYLQGRLAADGVEAVKFYQAIVDNFPKSEWADDALFRIVQYYNALGLYKTAELRLQQLKHDYPNSPHATGQPEAARQSAPPPAPTDRPVKLASPDTSARIAARDGEAPPPPETAPPQPPAAHTTRAAATAASPYTLQTGAFSSVANAEKQKAFFEDLGYSAEITNKIRAGRSLFLVWVGSYRSADEARVHGREIHAKYKIDALIVERY